MASNGEQRQRLLALSDLTEPVVAPANQALEMSIVSGEEGWEHIASHWDND